MLPTALDFDELAAAGHDHVGVHFGVFVFDVIQIEECLAVEDSDADRGDGVDQRVFSDAFRIEQFLNGETGGDVTADGVADDVVTIELQRVDECLSMRDTIFDGQIGWIVTAAISRLIASPPIPAVSPRQPS